MTENIPQDVLNQLKATNGQVITCKAAVAWEAKKPLDITDIQVSDFRLDMSTCACSMNLMYQFKPNSAASGVINM